MKAGLKTQPTILNDCPTGREREREKTRALLSGLFFQAEAEICRQRRWIEEIVCCRVTFTFFLAPEK